MSPPGEQAGQPRATVGNSRRVAARTIAVGLTLAIAGALAARSLMWATMVLEPLYAGDQRLIERQIRIEQIVPEIAARPEPIALLVGSSIAESALSPDVFDAQARADGRPLAAYNLGIASMDNEMQALLDGSLCRGLVRAGRRVDVAVLDIDPFQTVVQVLNLGPVLDVRKSLANGSDAWLSWLRSPSRFLRLGALRLLGGQSAQFETQTLDDLLYDDWRHAVADARPRRLIDQAMLREDGAEELPWNRKDRGEVRHLRPSTRALYLTFTKYSTSPGGIRRQREHFGMDRLEQMNFDPSRVEDLVRAGRELSACADKRYLVVFPLNPACVRPDRAAMARYDAVIERVAKDAGMDVLDLRQARGIEPGDFLDCTHFNETSGRPKISRLLADRLASSGGHP